MLLELAGLLYAPLHAQCLHVVVALTTLQLLDQLGGIVYVEGLGQHGTVVQRGKRLDARNDGHVDAGLAHALHKVEIAAVVEKHLGHDVLRTCLDLGFQIGQVGVGVHGLLVFFGIAGHTVSKGGGQRVALCAVNQQSGIEVVHLPAELFGMCVSAGSGHEAVFTAGTVTPQHNEVGDVQE